LSEFGGVLHRLHHRVSGDPRQLGHVYAGQRPDWETRRRGPGGAGSQV